MSPFNLPAHELPLLIPPGPSRGAGVGEAAESRLRSNAYLALKNISCEYDDGVLKLRGCVPTYYLKQMAQEVVTPLAGVKEIANEIEVVAPALLDHR